MSRFKSAFYVLLLTVFAVIGARAQSYDGQVTGTLSGAIHKYSGEFTDDLWGPGGFVSLQYAPIDVLQIEARFGLGEIKWKVTPSDIARYPDYFGQGAEIGDPYPGTLTTIEPENESRLTTIDLLVNYVIVDDIPAVPFITVGVGWVSFAPSNSEEHDALPNNGAGVYSGSSFSIPLGGGVRIPFSDRVGLLLRGEYRFVFSEYLDDFTAEGVNDAVTSVSVGLTYSFTDPPRSSRRHGHGQGHGYTDGTCGCCGMMDGHKSDCPCAMHGRGATGAAPAQQPKSAPSQDAPAADDAPTTNGGGGATTAPPAGETTEPAAGSATNAPNEPTEAPSQRTPSVSAQIEPCPPGSARICVDTDKSVCVDTTFSPGRARIKWEDAMIYDPGNPGHLQRLGDVGGETPCYAHVVRETSSAFYQAVDSCFERKDLGGIIQYDLLGEGRVVKGEGAFEPEDCPDCRTVVQQGR